MKEQQSSTELQPRDTGSWANQITPLKVGQVPAGARNINVDGRRVAGPVQGFGQMWQKTYQLQMDGVDASPEDVFAIWKANFHNFQPKMNRFYMPEHGFDPGEVALIDSDVARMPMVSTGVMVLYSDESSFTFMTPEGHPEAGWITFSVDRDDSGCVVAQIQSLARAADPIYEFGFRVFGSRMQENIWKYVLTSLATHFDCAAAITVNRVRVDRKMQWRRAGNVWQNAQIRTTLHTVTKPLRSVRSRTGG